MIFSLIILYVLLILAFIFKFIDKISVFGCFLRLNHLIDSKALYFFQLILWFAVNLLYLVFKYELSAFYWFTFTIKVFLLLIFLYVYSVISKESNFWWVALGIVLIVLLFSKSALDVFDFFRLTVSAIILRVFVPQRFSHLALPTFRPAFALKFIFTLLNRYRFRKILWVRSFAMFCVNVS